MKKFECAYCVNIGKVYYCYRHDFNNKNYYFCLCDNHSDFTTSGDVLITYEEFVAAKAMEAL